MALLQHTTSSSAKYAVAFCARPFTGISAGRRRHIESVASGLDLSAAAGVVSRRAVNSLPFLLAALPSSSMTTQTCGTHRSLSSISKWHARAWCSRATNLGATCRRLQLSGSRNERNAPYETEQDESCTCRKLRSNFRSPCSLDCFQALSCVQFRREVKSSLQRGKYSGTNQEYVVLNDGNKMPLLGLGTAKADDAAAEKAVGYALGKAGYRCALDRCLQNT